MKRKLILIITLLLLFFSINIVTAQITDTSAFIKSQMTYSTMRYDSFNTIAKTYFESNTATTDDEKRDRRIYARWNNFWQSRMGITDATGTHIDADYAYKLNKKLAKGEILC